MWCDLSFPKEQELIVFLINRSGFYGSVKLLAVSEIRYSKEK